MPTLAVEFAARVPSGANLREHWRARHARAKGHRAAAYAHLLAASRRAPGPGAPTLPAVVTITRVSNRAIRDGDNLAYACKGLRDGVADFVGRDDSDPGYRWVYAHRFASSKHLRVLPGQVVVRIEIAWGAAAAPAPGEEPTG